MVQSIARGQRARGLWVPEGLSCRLTQRISTTLNREAARGILFRLNGARKVGSGAPEPVVVEDIDSDVESEGWSSDEEEDDGEDL